MTVSIKRKRPALHKATVPFKLELVRRVSWVLFFSIVVTVVLSQWRGYLWAWQAAFVLLGAIFVCWGVEIYLEHNTPAAKSARQRDRASLEEEEEDKVQTEMITLYNKVAATEAIEKVDPDD